MVGPIKDRPVAEAEGSDRKFFTGKRLALAASALVAIALAAGGGYLIGRDSGADVDAARTDGEEMGWTRGTSIGADIYPRGLDTGRKITYARTYRDAYREAYVRAFKGSEISDVPKAESIQVAVP